ncbi:MAG TPA: transposase [Acidobacteriaceae bacterium]|jgi:putative transposase|nr:transposase [Acidobacteriaceae bacterium]
MTTGLVRYQKAGDLHFITVSCYQRRPYFALASARNLFQYSLEAMRVRYDFFVSGYVVMPEHVHLLISEPKRAALSKAMQALKLSMTVRHNERPFWQPRYYDFNVFTDRKRIEKLRYIHRNPVERGMAVGPEDWAWSSFRHYATGEMGAVEIESPWTALGRGRVATNSHVSEARRGAPGLLL